MPVSPVRRPRAARARNRSLVSLGAALLAVGSLVSGCALLNGPVPDTPKRAAPEAPATEVGYVPDGSAADNKPFFTKLLVDYGKGDGAIQGEPIERTLTDAGFPAEHTQVTQDEDPFGNPAESIFVSVRFADQCLIGQLVAADRQVVIDEAKAIGPDRDQCLIVQPR